MRLVKEATTNKGHIVNLSAISVQKKRVNYTKFRISAHTIHVAIETGRHTRPGIPVEHRLCRF